MSTMDTPEHKETQQGGNTNPPANEREKRSRKWVGTLNTYSEEEYQNLLFTFGPHKFIIGKEVGESGTPHLQMYVNFGKNPRSLRTMKIINSRAHWEFAKGNDGQNYNYCSKDGEFRTNMEAPPVPVELSVVQELRPWQTQIVKLLEQKSDDRTIYWVCDKVGNSGKTQLCKYLAVKKNALVLEGKAADMKYTVTKYWLDNKKSASIPPLMMDLTRSQDGFISYSGIEAMKNGMYMNTKYESCMVLYNSPHLVVFANFMPDTEKLSADRWHVLELEDGTLKRVSYGACRSNVTTPMVEDSDDEDSIRPYRPQIPMFSTDMEYFSNL